MKLANNLDTLSQAQQPGMIIKLAVKLLIISITAAIFLFHPMAVNLGVAGPCDADAT